MKTSNFNIGQSIYFQSNKTEKIEKGEIIVISENKAIYIASHAFGGSEVIWENELNRIIK